MDSPNPQWLQKSNSVKQNKAGLFQQSQHRKPCDACSFWAIWYKAENDTKFEPERETLYQGTMPLWETVYSQWLLYRQLGLSKTCTQSQSGARGQHCLRVPPGCAVASAPDWVVQLWPQVSDEQHISKQTPVFYKLCWPNQDAWYCFDFEEGSFSG